MANHPPRDPNENEDEEDDDEEENEEEQEEGLEDEYAAIAQVHSGERSGGELQLRDGLLVHFAAGHWSE